MSKGKCLKTLWEIKPISNIFIPLQHISIENHTMAIIGEQMSFTPKLSVITVK